MLDTIPQKGPEIPREFAGRWVAWDRDQTRIIATGRTFEEAKKAAAAAGQVSVLLAKVPSSEAWFRYGRHLLHAVAVYISISQIT